MATWRQRLLPRVRVDRSGKGRAGYFQCLNLLARGGISVAEVREHPRIIVQHSRLLGTPRSLRQELHTKHSAHEREMLGSYVDDRNIDNVRTSVRRVLDALWQMLSGVCRRHRSRVRIWRDDLRVSSH